MNGKTGSSTITYRLKLYCKHPEWVRDTEALYNEVLAFYYGLLTNNSALLELGNLDLLRRLEQMTVVGRDKQPVASPLPFAKVPLYFRRAAINAAIGHARSYAGLVRNWELKRTGAEQKGIIWKKERPVEPQAFHSSMVFYKGMFKEFGQGSILLKLWNGHSWVWLKHTYCGRKIPENGICLSPTLVKRGKSIFLHVPVKCPVEDTRTIKERMAAGERFCTVYFTASDVLATCVLFGSDGHAEDSHFVRGGKEFAYRRKCLLNRIKKNRNLIGGNLKEGENGRYWMNVRNLSDYCAHLVSRRILDYCIKNNVKFLVVPQYAVPLKEKGTEEFLGRRAIQYLVYKAWKAGIAITKIRPYFISAKCNHCGAAVNNFSGTLFICPNNHRGNTALNFAKNLGMQFQKKIAFVREEKAG